MESNRKALMILQLLVFTAVIIFFIEKKFLISESRGSTLSHYSNFAGISHVVLLVEDFEGFDRHLKSDSLLQTSGFFTYGSIKVDLDMESVDNNPLASATALKASWSQAEPYGGWGKGVGANIELNTQTDFLNFRILIPEGALEEDQIRVMLQEDDDEDGVLNEKKDDKWASVFKIKPSQKWQTVSLALKDFVHDGDGGDGIFNVTRKGGLHNLIFNFERPEAYTPGYCWYFDFICFSSGKLNTQLN
jgi:hypothetical protein